MEVVSVQGVGTGGAVASGLEGVVAADTAVTLVDGAEGVLLYRGYSVETLAQTATFEDVLHLLVAGALPTAGERAALRRQLGAARARAFSRLPELGDALALPAGMDALRASVAHVRLDGADEPLVVASELAGAIAVSAAAWARARTGRAPLAPDAEAPHAADYLRMVVERTPSQAERAAIDAYFTTVADHGLCASTFVARIVASTQSDAVSAVVAAIGALKGPLHGGAPGPVLDMLDAIGRPEDAAAWLETELAAGRRIMGMGHRIYRVRDPRAAVLEAATGALQAAGVAGAKLTLARAVEREAARLLRVRHAARPLCANVEFYTATLLDALDLPRELFTPTFTAARVAGWCAHVDEQRRTGRLVRPSARYVGPLTHAGC